MISLVLAKETSFLGLMLTYSSVNHTQMYCIIFHFRLQVLKSGKQRTSCELSVKKRETSGFSRGFSHFFRICNSSRMLEGIGSIRPSGTHSQSQCIIQAVVRAPEKS